MNRFLLLLCIIICSISTNLANEVDFDGLLNIKLYHSLSNTHETQYTERGNISVHGAAIFVNNLPLSQKDKAKFQVLAAEDKFYRLKAIVINNDRTETEFLTFTKACMLAQSGLSDYLSISLDHSENVVAISLGVPPGIYCQGSNVSIEKLNKFKSKVFINVANAGSIPDTASYIQKLEREREAKERGDVKDNRSFLAKYWMYIVPVVILMVLSSAANPDGGGGGAARQS